MQLRPRNHLYWCECAGRIVFLDVTADRYSSLPERSAAAFLRLAAGKAEPQDEEHLGGLVRRGLLVASASPDPFQQPAAIEPPGRDILEDPAPRAGILPIMRALAREMQAGWQLRTMPFCRVVARAGRPPRYSRAASGNSERATRSIAAAADTIALVTRSHNRCLVRALAVQAACRARGIRARFVIGVIAHPFAAHSWVQVGDAVLVGSYEQARLYTPILVTG